MKIRAICAASAVALGVTAIGPRYGGHWRRRRSDSLTPT